MIIYTKMVADLFHFGHVQFLKQAKAAGSHLVVHIVDDERVTSFKRRPIMTQQERIEVVSACRWVDEVVADGPKIITNAFMKENGYSRYAFACKDKKEERIKRLHCPDLTEDQITILHYTPNISTTDIIARLHDRLKAE